MKDMKPAEDARAGRLLERRRRAAEQFPPVEQVLRGTLGKRWVRCGKAGCHCRKGRGHGPVRYLTVTLAVGRTRQVTVTAEDLETVRRHVRNYRRLWELLELISAINRELLQRRSLPRAELSASGSRSRQPRRAGRRDR